MINRERLVKTFCDLVQIDSPSGEEETVAIELCHRLKRLGIDVIRDNYGNMIASLPGDNPILLSAHMDTVEPGRSIEPVVDSDRISSNGDTIIGGDCKAGVAAILEAIESILEDDMHHKGFEIAFTREEEIGLVGAQNLDFSKINSKEAIVFDGEGPVSQITSASPTYISFDLQITGRAAHAGVEPEKGISAVHIAAKIITLLPQGRLDHETTFNVGLIEGGSVRNTVPENTTIRGEFRSRNLETLDEMTRQLTDAINQVRKNTPEAEIQCDIHEQFRGYSLTDDDTATYRVKEALKSLGLKPVMKPSGGGTDGNVFRQHGVSAVVVGMADTNMHTVREFVTISDLVDAAHLCEVLVTST